MNVKPAGQRNETHRILMVILAVFLMVGGILLSPLPIPVPIGLVTFLAGFAILVTYSKSSRRFVQYIRHRNDWLSRTLDWATHRAPQRDPASRPHPRQSQQHPARAQPASRGRLAR